MSELTELPWRIGRKNPYTIYAVVGDSPSDDDPYLGSLNTPELSAEVVTSRIQLAALSSYIADIHDEATALVPVSTLEVMGQQRDALRDEIIELRKQISLVPPALWAAAQGSPHGE